MSKVSARPATVDKSSKELVVASVRYVLANVAWWTTFMFDEGAHERIAKLPEQFPSGKSVKDFLLPNSAGRLAENSLLLPAISRAYDLATTGLWHGSTEQLNVAATEVKPLWYLLNNPAALCGPYDDPLMDSEAAELLLPFIDCLFGRLALVRGRAVNLPQMALISGLSEKTLRMTAKSGRLNRGAVKPGDPALYTFKEGQRTWVTPEEAARWLRLKPGYRPTRLAKEGVNLQPKTTLELAATLSSLRETAGLSVERLMERCGLPAKAVKTYELLEAGWCDPKKVNTKQFDVPALMSMSAALKVRYVPTFVQAVRDIFTTIEMAQVNAEQRSVRRSHE